MFQALSSATDFESTETDGKWAEEDSDVSSVDEFDSVSIKGRREEFETRKAFVLSEVKSQDGDTEDGKLNRGSKEGGHQKGQVLKAKGNTASNEAKKGKIRFKEEGRANENQKMGRGGKKTTKKGKKEEEAKEDNASDVSGDPKEEKRNKYLDEWLGIKREPVDTRYQPGKPPPNRWVRLLQCEFSACVLDFFFFFLWFFSLYFFPVMD